LLGYDYGGRNFDLFRVFNPTTLKDCL